MTVPLSVYPTIHKGASELSAQMPDYDALRADFSWKAMEEALGLPHPNGVNKATVCIDAHPPEVMQRDALLWEGTNGRKERYTFMALKQATNRFANVLTDLGVKKGDRVFVYLERIPEVFITMFGTLKVGAVVGPLFSAFGPEAIRDRLQDSGATVIITSLTLKPRLDAIREELPELRHVILVNRDSAPVTATASEEPGLVCYETAMAAASDEFEVPYTNPDDYSIMHYTSGTTGKPKGAVHRHGAIVAQYATSRYILDFRPESDRYWCTADAGWVTGTSYGMFGPWSMGVSVIVYEGPFKAEDWYRIVQDYGVTVWYTAPTAIRMLMKAGENVARNYDFSSLRHLCSVGEPLNPEAIVWGQMAFGHVFHDTWWQTETGAMQICNAPCLDVKPGSMGKPVPGVEAGILDDEWNPLPLGQEGNLAIRPTGPSLFRTYWNRDEVYQSRFRNGWYLTGDRARLDEEGYYWFIGRSDDVINTAGHLVGPFEVESALVEHPAVAEAGVIGKPDPERMEIVKAFVSLKAGFEPSDELKRDIQSFVRNRLAAHAYPREIDFLPGLPKTRSGKIMRRLLKARELGLPEGDTSTLEE
jgi:acetyl-CoA synthetase